MIKELIRLRSRYPGVRTGLRLDKLSEQSGPLLFSSPLARGRAGCWAGALLRVGGST